MNTFDVETDVSYTAEEINTISFLKELRCAAFWHVPENVREGAIFDTAHCSCCRKPLWRLDDQWLVDEVKMRTLYYPR